jgi:hypothetical protein
MPSSREREMRGCLMVDLARDFGADRATREPSLAARLGPAGECYGYEAWREALATFCERDCLAQKAENLRRGVPLDYLDKRMIDALRAAFQEMAA